MKKNVRIKKSKTSLQIIITVPSTKEAIKKIVDTLFPSDDTCKYCGGELENWGMGKICKNTKCGMKQ